jgi:hypothetical protein
MEKFGVCISTADVCNLARCLILDFSMAASTVLLAFNYRRRTIS